MRLSIEAYDETHSTDMRDDATVTQCVRVFVNLMCSAGYCKENLVDLFKDGDPTAW